MYKTILVHVDETAHSACRIEVAARLANLYDAHLVGAAVTGLASYLLPQVGLDPGAPAMAFPIDALHAEADRALDLFDRQADGQGVRSFERRRIDEEAGTAISLHARYCDLVVISQSALDKFTPRLRTDFPELIVMAAYGHSRFSEILLGGASRMALLSSPIPLWMTH